MILMCLIASLLFTSSSLSDVSQQKVSLHMKDVCWSYKSDNPVFICTVYSQTGTTIWKRDTKLIATDGDTVGDERDMYDVTYVAHNKTMSVEELEVMSRAVLETSEFWCENQGHSSLRHSIDVPDCGACQSCYTTTPLLVNVTSLHSQPDSAKASVILVITFVVAAVVITVMLCIYFCLYRCHLRRQQLPVPAMNSTPSLSDLDLEQDSISPLPQFATLPTNNHSSSLPILGYSSREVTPRSSIQSVSRVEYLRADDYKLTRIPSYRSSRGSILHTSLTGSIAPIALPETDNI